MHYPDDRRRTCRGIGSSAVRPQRGGCAVSVSLPLLAEYEEWKLGLSRAGGLAQREGAVSWCELGIGALDAVPGVSNGST